MARSFKDLVAWQKAMDMADAIYDATAAFPQREMYRLADQMRRAAVSIPSNIAEGQARFSNRDFRHFLRDARGSLAELETQILIAERRHYLKPQEAAPLNDRVVELGRILNGLMNAIQVED
jgi:four helix bundle protein